MSNGPVGATAVFIVVKSHGVRMIRTAGQQVPAFWSLKFPNLSPIQARPKFCGCGNCCYNSCGSMSLFKPLCENILLSMLMWQVVSLREHSGRRHEGNEGMSEALYIALFSPSDLLLLLDAGRSDKRSFLRVGYYCGHSKAFKFYLLKWLARYEATRIVLKSVYQSLYFAAFVFLALLEFTVVNYLWRNNPRSRSTRNRGAEHGLILEAKENHGSERPVSACNTLVQVS